MSNKKTKMISIELNYHDGNSEPHDPMFSLNNYMPFGGNCEFIRDKNLCEKTKHAVTRVYTQDMKNKFQAYLTQPARSGEYTNDEVENNNILNEIKKYNPRHRFTTDIICPPDLTLLDSFDRLKQNLLFNISEAINVIIFGGTVLSGTENVKYVPFLLGNDEKLLDFYDAQIFDYFISKNNLKLKTISYTHFGFDQQYTTFKNNYIAVTDMLKIKCFNRYGIHYKMNSNRVLNCINIIDDESRPKYNLEYVESMIKNIIDYNISIKYIELNIAYEYNDTYLDNISIKFRKLAWHTEFYKHKIILFNLSLDILNEI